MKISTSIMREDGQSMVPLFENDNSGYPYNNAFNEIIYDEIQKLINRSAIAISMLNSYDFNVDVFRASPYSIFNSRPEDFEKNGNPDPEARFNLVDLYLDVMFRRQNFMDCILSEYAQDENNLQILNDDETDYHTYFRIVFHDRINGRYLTPEEVNEAFQPRFNVRDIRENFEEITTDEELRGILRTLKNLIDNKPASSLPVNFGPFYFYGNEPENPQPNTSSDVEGTQYANFDPSNFHRLYQHISNNDFSYRNYLRSIYQILNTYTQEPVLLESVILQNRTLEIGSRMIELDDLQEEEFASEFSIYELIFYAHTYIVLNRDAINNELSDIENEPAHIFNQAKRIRFASHFAHELGHILANILYPEKQYAYNRISNSLLRPGDEQCESNGSGSGEFPDYPYAFGGGHFRGNLSGSLACQLGSRVEKILLRKHRKFLESILMYNSFSEEWRRKHFYDVDQDGLPLTEPGQDHGYCFNNVNPANINNNE